MRQSVHFANGVGCQSNALMALIKFDKQWLFSKLGEVPEIAWTVDTNAEVSASYKAIAFWWKHSPIDYRIISSNKSLLWEEYQGKISLPYFSIGEDGRGQLQRRCCPEYKVKVLRYALRQHLNYGRSAKIPDKRVKLWVGISAGELGRIRSDNDWVVNRYPLVELGWTRYDCVKYLRSHNLEFLTEHSSCYICPFMKKPDWEKLSKLQFNAANLFEFKKRRNNELKNDIFLHASRKALGSKFYFSEDVDLQSHHDF